MLNKKNNMMELRKEIEAYIGVKVKIRANKGRKKIVVREGIVKKTYPSLFVVSIEHGENNADRTVTYSYADVLTHTVELSPCSE